MRKNYFLLIAAIFLLAGCATTASTGVLMTAPKTPRKSIQLEKRIKEIKKIAVMPLDIEVYQISAGGVTEMIDEYTEQAKSNCHTALDTLIGSDYKLSYLADLKYILDNQEKTVFKQVLAFYRALEISIVAHTYVGTESGIPYAAIFEDKINNFDYGFGKNIGLLRNYAQADALLFVRGSDQVMTSGRKALVFWASVLAGTVPLPGGHYISMALIDANTGDVLWFNVMAPMRDIDFKQPASLINFFKMLLKDFPKGGQ